jgi:hypothetical protein
VAIGTLAGLFLSDRPGPVVCEVYDFCESVGLPTTLADIGLADATDDDLRVVAEAACADGESIHHEPCPVSPGAVAAALRTADRFLNTHVPASLLEVLAVDAIPIANEEAWCFVIGEGVDDLLGGPFGVGMVGHVIDGLLVDGHLLSQGEVLGGQTEAADEECSDQEVNRLDDAHGKAPEG